MSALTDVHGDLLIVRPPVLATCNKAGANYKSEVSHLDYSPRRAYDEWLSICDAILACGGDALYQFEAADEPFLGHEALEVDGMGDVRPAGSSEVLGNLSDIETGRVFTANGPWVTIADGVMRAVMQHMLPHRTNEVSYYGELLGRVADAAGLTLRAVPNPHRWEGMADVAVVGEKVILTYAVPGHYDQGQAPKSPRSSLEGVTFVADQLEIPRSARVAAELIYPHFHGDTVHFAARPPHAPPTLVHYAGGLWGNGHDNIVRILKNRVAPIGMSDAVHHYAGNSRQVRNGVLVPDGVSPSFLALLDRLGLKVHRIPLFELFGKAGGGPACATLYMPRNLVVPENAPFRYGATRDLVTARREAIPEKLSVSPDFFSGKSRG